MIYSVVFAFVVVSTWEQFEDARGLKDAESQAVADLIRLLPGLPDARRAEAQAALAAYMNAAIEVEWPRMVDGKAAGAETAAQLDRLWAVYGVAQDAPEADRALFDEGVDRLITLGE